MRFILQASYGFDWVSVGIGRVVLDNSQFMRNRGVF